jgi:hypothetical protein
VILAHLEDPVAPLVLGDVVADEVGVSHGKWAVRISVQ